MNINNADLERLTTLFTDHFISLAKTYVPKGGAKKRLVDAGFITKDGNLTEAGVDYVIKNTYYEMVIIKTNPFQVRWFRYENDYRDGTQSDKDQIDNILKTAIIRRLTKVVGKSTYVLVYKDVK